MFFVDRRTSLPYHGCQNVWTLTLKNSTANRWHNKHKFLHYFSIKMYVSQWQVKALTAVAVILHVLLDKCNRQSNNSAQKSQRWNEKWSSMWMLISRALNFRQHCSIANIIAIPFHPVKWSEVFPVIIIIRNGSLS